LSQKGQVPNDRQTLARVAVEAETQFLCHLLETMRKSMVKSLGSRQADLKGYQSLADQHLARALTLGGGLGLARQLYSDLAAKIPGVQEVSANDRELNHDPERDLPLSGTP
jgi:Rod binding domain-containing protein